MNIEEIEKQFEEIAIQSQPLFKEKIKASKEITKYQKLKEISKKLNKSKQHDFGRDNYFSRSRSTNRSPNLDIRIF